MSVNIGQLKQQLQSLGISTNTPGLLGDERYEELRKRLDLASVKVGHHLNENKVSGESKVIFSFCNFKNEIDIPLDYQDSSSSLLPSLSHLSIGEIRTRLTALGESTTTPDMTGDERRNELLRRLINCVCAEKEATVVQQTMFNEVNSHATYLVLLAALLFIFNFIISFYSHLINFFLPPSSSPRPHPNQPSPCPPLKSSPSLQTPHKI
jgi:hypothetical protein